MSLSSMNAMSCSSSSSPFSLLGFSFSPSNKPKISYTFSLPRKRKLRISCLRPSVESISDLVHNKVLVAATVAAAIGQISKPFTAAANGKGIDWRAAIRSGGMPSTHSASVVAVTTTLGLERGFSDAIFGMSVVFAAIVMYDSQGVRKEVGYQARILNKIISLQQSSVPCLDRADGAKADTGTHNIDNSESEISNLFPVNENSVAYTSTVTAKQLDTMSGLKTTLTDLSETSAFNCEPLSESVGHTGVQVLVGALLGFILSLVIDTVL